MKVELDEKDLKTILAALYVAANNGSISQDDYYTAKGKLVEVVEVKVCDYCPKGQPCTCTTWRPN